MDDILEGPRRKFGEVAASQAKAALEIDPDIAEYLKSQFLDDWQRMLTTPCAFTWTPAREGAGIEPVARQEPDEHATVPEPS